MWTLVNIEVQSGHNRLKFLDIIHVYDNEEGP